MTRGTIILTFATWYSSSTFMNFFTVILFFQFASRFRDKLWMMIQETKNDVRLSVYLIIGSKFIVVINELSY